MNAIASSSRSSLLSSASVPPRILSSSARSFSSSSRCAAANASHNHYRTLDIDRAATKKQIKEKFYELSKKYHPDLTPGDAVAKAKYLSISEAYDTLGNEAKRSNYDRTLAPVPRQSPHHTSSHYTRTGRPSTWVHPSTRLPPRPRAHPLKPHHLSSAYQAWPSSSQPKPSATYQNTQRPSPPGTGGATQAPFTAGSGEPHAGTGPDGLNPDTLKSRFNPSTGRAEYYTTSAPGWGGMGMGIGAGGSQDPFVASGQGSGGQSGQPLKRKGGSREDRERSHLWNQAKEQRETTLKEEFMDGTGGLWMVGASAVGLGAGYLFATNATDGWRF